MAKGILEERVAAPLLLGAGVLDLLVVYVLARSAASYWWHDIPLLREAYATPALFLALVLILWLLCDLVLAGYTPGRLAFGIEMVSAQGGRPGFGRRLMRLGGKLTCAGLAGLRLDRCAGYDRLGQVRWRSAMTSTLDGAAQTWVLRFASGAYAGKKLSLGQLRGFAQRPEIRIGRDRDWANLAINDPGLSARHCVVRVIEGRIEVRDASANGTFIGERRLQPGRWVRWDPARPLRVGSSTMRLDA